MAAASKPADGCELDGGGIIIFMDAMRANLTRYEKQPLKLFSEPTRHSASHVATHAGKLPAVGVLLS